MGGIHGADSHAPRFRHARGLTALLSLGTMLIASPLIATSAGATAVRHTSTTTSNAALLTQGKKFYRGKTITIIAPDAPGGGFDQYARALGPVVGTYLHASVDITNIAPANTITGQDAFAAANPDGLTIGMINPGADILNEISNTPGVNFNPLRVAFLGASGGGATEYSCLTSSGITSMSQVITSTKPISEVIVTTGTQTIEMRLVNASFGFPTDVITGYTSTHSEVQGYERGDGNCSVLGIGDVATFIAAGKATILMRTADVNKGTAYYGEQATAPYFSKLEQQYPAKTNRERLARVALLALGTVGHQFNVQTKVSEDKVLALRAAFQFAFENKSVQSLLLSEGNEVGFVNGLQTKLDYEQEYTALKHVASIIGA